jgi:hypothetical protein
VKAHSPDASGGRRRRRDIRAPRLPSRDKAESLNRCTSKNPVVSQLTKKEIQDISVMLDFDMLGLPNYGRFIYDGNGDEHGFAGPNGSGQVFKDFWSSEGLAYETIPFDGRSDYDAFTTAGIPAGGIFAGAEVKKTPDQVQLYGGEAGVPFDVCYHQLCDRLTNINDRGLSEHSDAAVHAILTFAQTESSVNGTDQGTSKKSKEWKGHHRVRWLTRQEYPRSIRAGVLLAPESGVLPANHPAAIELPVQCERSVDQS